MNDTQRQIQMALCFVYRPLVARPAVVIVVIVVSVVVVVVFVVANNKPQ